jgi:hypothetical protein
MKESESFAKRIYPDYDYDYFEAYMKVFHYKCTTCRIEFQQDEKYDSKGEWTLPENLKPTEKQISYATAIANRLGKDIRKLVTKKQYSKFISDNVEAYKQKKKEDYDINLYNLALDLEEWGVIDPGMFC